MRSVTVIIQLAFFAQATEDAKYSMDNLVDELFDKMFARLFKASPLHHADLDDTSLAKPGLPAIQPSAVGTSGLSSPMSLPVRQGRLQSVPNVIAHGLPQPNIAQLRRQELMRLKDWPAAARTVAAAAESETPTRVDLKAIGKPGWTPAPGIFTPPPKTDGAAIPEATEAAAAGEEVVEATTTAEPLEARSVTDAWNNHFSAFGEKDLDKIMDDYTQESTIVVFNQVTGMKTKFKGLAMIKDFFKGLFESLSDTSDLAAPVQIVEEPSSLGEPGTVFLTWSCPASGYASATDTFIFESNGRIKWQNVAVSYTNPSDEESKEEDKGTNKGLIYTRDPWIVFDTWCDHFEWFEEQVTGVHPDDKLTDEDKEDFGPSELEVKKLTSRKGTPIDKIVGEYSDKSIIRVYNQATGESKEYKGESGAREYYTGLFKTLKDTSDLKYGKEAMLVDLEETLGDPLKLEDPGDPGNTGMIFNNWACPASGYDHVSETWVMSNVGPESEYDVLQIGYVKPGPILRQNIVYNYKP